MTENEFFIKAILAIASSGALGDPTEWAARDTDESFHRWAEYVEKAAAALTEMAEENDAFE